MSLLPSALWRALTPLTAAPWRKRMGNQHDNCSYPQLGQRANPINARHRWWCSAVGCRCCSPEEVGGDGGGERASAQEVLVVRPLDAIADAGAEPCGFEISALDPAANGLL